MGATADRGRDGRGVRLTIAIAQQPRQPRQLTVVVLWPPQSAPSPTAELELWALTAGGTPHSLGAIDPDGTTMVPTQPHGTRLVVSLEPKGGSPTGVPTGPELFTNKGASK